MSRSERYDLGDTKPTNLLMGTDNYARVWFVEGFGMEVFLTRQLPSDVRSLMRMHPSSTPVSELARMTDLWVTVNHDISTTPPSDIDTIELLRRQI